MILMYEGTYTLPGIGIRLYTEKILLSVVIAIIFGVLASYFSCRKTLKESASSAMRPLAPKAGKKLLIERCKKIWAGLSYSNKIVMRNTFSNKKRAILSSIGIIGSISLIITAFGMKDSMDKVLDTQYDKIYNYDFKTDIIDIIAEGLASQNLSLEVIEDILNSDVVDTLEKLGLSDQMPVLRQKINQIIKSQNDSKKTWELSDEEKERANDYDSRDEDIITVTLEEDYEK